MFSLVAPKKRKVVGDEVIVIMPKSLKTFSPEQCFHFGKSNL